MKLNCVLCGKEYPDDKETMNCHCNGKYYGKIEVVYDLKKINEFPLKNEIGLKRYLPLLPLKTISSNTPYIKTPLFKMKNEIYVKDETRNLTGTFKDREATIVINKAVEFEINKIFAISSGNLAHSMSAYGKINNIPCKCFIPNSVPNSKKNAIRLFGGDVFLVGNSYEECYRNTIDLNVDGWNTSPSINPYALEGDKVIAFELYEELGEIDKIVVPCGNGTLLAGIFKGFKELKELGLISKTPKMIGVQIEGASPIFNSFYNKQDINVVEDPVDSIADSIVASESYTSIKTIKALNESNGFMTTVKDVEIRESLIEMIQTEGLFLEPASASVFSSLKHFEFDKDEKIVCIASGSGLKVIDELKEIILKNK